MEQSAVAYLAHERLIIAPVVRTTTGLRLEIEPNTLGNTADQNRIAEALATALSNSARIVPHPAQDQWKGFFIPFQQAAGVRSHKAFMQDAQRVSIKASEDRLKLTPQRNLGSKEGFEPIAEAAILLSRNDLMGAAAALIRLLGLNAP